MNIAIIGASGWIGSHLLQEALARGHHVTALVRTPLALAELNQANLTVREFDISRPDWTQLQGADVVLSAIGGRASANHELVPMAAKQLLAELPKLGIQRLLWVGGAGSLLGADGQPLLANPEFPSAYRAEAEAQGQALSVFRESQSAIDWTFISPAAEIFPSEAQGTYRIGHEQLLVDAQGRSRIAVSDYAKAMLDEVAQHRYPQQRIGVAY